MGGIRNSANKVRKFLSEHGPKIIETVAGKANNAALQEQIQQGARVIKRAWEGSNWKQILGKDRKSQGNAAQATGNAAQDTGNVAQATDNSAQATGNVAQQFSNVTEQFGNTSQSAASSPTQGAETAGKNFTPALHQLSKYAPKLKALVKPEIKPELSFSDLSKNNADENKATTPRRPSGP
jgi:thioredoxin-like negative regulator of GroEL